MGRSGSGPVGVKGRSEAGRRPVGPVGVRAGRGRSGPVGVRAGRGQAGRRPVGVRPVGGRSGSNVVLGFSGRPGLRRPAGPVPAGTRGGPIPVRPARTGTPLVSRSTARSPAAPRAGRPARFARYPRPVIRRPAGPGGAGTRIASVASLGRDGRPSGRKDIQQCQGGFLSDEPNSGLLPECLTHDRADPGELRMVAFQVENTVVALEGAIGLDRVRLPGVGGERRCRGASVR